MRRRIGTTDGGSVWLSARQRRLTARLRQSPRIARLRIATGRLIRSPLLATFPNFFLTTIMGGAFLWFLNSLNHHQDVEAATRNSAVAAVVDVSELVNERRVRAGLTINAIRRLVPEAEANARKAAYDDAFVRWNAKMPGDLLRIRAGLNLSRRSDFERYIDALTDASNLLPAGDSSLPQRHFPERIPGLLSILDDCVTNAFDAYRADLFKNADKANELLRTCHYAQVYSMSVRCFAMIAESMYSAVNGIAGIGKVAISEADVVQACMPPRETPAASAAVPAVRSPPARPP
jgi:hypothetical protein